MSFRSAISKPPLLDSFQLHMPAHLVSGGIQILFFIALCSGALAKAPPGHDMDLTGTLDGKLTDTRSVPLSRVTVVVRNLITGSVARTVTGKNGSYHFPSLGPGEYRLEATAEELGNGAVDGIFIWAGHVTRIQAALLMEAGGPSGLPDDALQPIDLTVPILTTQIENQELNSLPLALRDGGPVESSGVSAHTSQPSPEDQAEGRALSNEAFADAFAGSGLTELLTSVGTEDMRYLPEYEAAPSREGAREPHGGLITLSEDMQTAADPGRGSETIPFVENVAQAPRHNQKSIHGQISYSDRRTAWGSRNSFSQWVRESAPASGIETAQFTVDPYTPPDQREAFLFGLGGQLRKKTAWFTSLESLSRDYPGVAMVRHPADLFAQPSDDALSVLAARLNSSGPAVMEAAASAYSGGLEQLGGLLGPVPRSSRRWNGFARLDRQLGERQRFALAEDFSDVDAPGGARTRTAEMFGSHSFGNSHADIGWVNAHWEAFLTANLLNATTAQFRLHRLRDTPQAPSAFELPLIANAWGELPEIIADSRSGFVLGKPAQLGRSNYPDERVFRGEDTLSWVHRRHLIKFGSSFEHLSDAVSSLPNQTGTYSYANVLNFISDVASFEKYGLNDIGNPYAGQHNCDQTGRVHRSEGELLGLGYLPCYAWYSQRVGPANWHLSSNDLATFFSDQWQPWHRLTLSASLRVETQQLPPPIALVANPDLIATQKLPADNLNWSPRFGLAWSPAKGTVLRFGAGLYFSRLTNAVLLATLTQTGSPNGDLNLFYKPTQNGAPPFPYVFSTQPQTVIRPGAVGFAGNFRLPEVDQALLNLEQQLPGNWVVSVSAVSSLGRRLPISIDTNLDSTHGPESITYTVIDTLRAGPLKSTQITVPFYSTRPNANYQQVASIESRANSTYDAARIQVTRAGSHGWNVHVHYLYGHATDWNPNESSQVAVNDVLDPRNFRAEYGASNLDIRHTAGATVLYQTPWKLRGWQGSLANNWTVGTIGQYRSGRPFTMRTSGYITGFVDNTRKLIEGVAPGMNGSGGDNRVYGVGRNTYRYPATWTADMRVSKRFEFRNEREFQVLVESFNLLNHQNVTRLETTGYTIDRGGAVGELPTLNFLTGLTKTGLPSSTPEFGKPLDVNASSYFRPREIQLGVKARF